MFSAPHSAGGLQVSACLQSCAEQYQAQNNHQLKSEVQEIQCKQITGPKDLGGR